MTAHMTTAQARALGITTTSGSKFRNVTVTADGRKFDSKAEYTHYLKLKAELEAGEISRLSLQPKFMLQESFKYQGKTERAITYIADFMYERDGKTIVEDVKGKKTDVYKMKRKLFLKRYGDKYEFSEVAA